MKSIKEMNNPYKSRIKTAIEKIPQGDIRKLQGYNNMYRLRIGDYRIIYKTTENGIYIDGVLPRGEAYKRLQEVFNMGKEALIELIDNVDEQEYDILFKIISKFVKEVPPMPDEVIAIMQGEQEYQNDEIYSHDEVWG